MNLMKLSFNRKFLTAVTLLSTILLGMESVQAATIPIDIAVIIPGQATVASTNIALKKKPSAKKKPGAKKKPPSAVKKPEEVPVTPPEDSPKTPDGVTGGAPEPPGQSAPRVPGQDVPKVPGDAPKAPMP
jgi:hypothetical protein